MPAVLLLAVFAALGLSIVLIPGLEQKVSHTIEDINGSMVQGVTGPIIQAWMVVAVLGAGLGLTIWAIEHKIGQKTGQVVALPDVQPIGVPAAPTFGSASGFSAGPFRSSVSAGGGQAPPALPGPSQPIFTPALRDAQQRSDRMADQRRQRADQQANARRQQQERQAQRDAQQRQQQQQRDAQRRQQQAQQQQQAAQAQESRRRYDLERADRLASAPRPPAPAGGGTVRTNRGTRRP